MLNTTPAMKLYEGVDVQFHTFLTLALDGGGTLFVATQQCSN